MSVKLSTRIQTAAASYPQWLLGALLLSLHVIIVGGTGAWWAGAAALVHLGLFLVWQPVLRGEQALSLKTAVLVILAGVLAFQGWQSGWGMTLWLGILVGLVGGQRRRHPGEAATSGLSFCLAVFAGHSFVLGGATPVRR